ncbi:hypothetical protein KIN20_030689 [Parelaphostrongylus tenuis]|uniref:Transmembrane protein 53 n=1 Tax=Parelaphostrongylus tenuis TaxID=148309 RepID=A0AAD5R450_PARTN|nr:hypothetical protein KIN20_030689 [Parelaphostrongylus tenuis]
MKATRKAVSTLVKPCTVSAIFPNSSKRTTILLLGWAGARDDHLAKYSQIYENEGFSTLRFTSAFDGHRRSLKGAPSANSMKQWREKDGMLTFYNSLTQATSSITENTLRSIGT